MINRIISFLFQDWYLSKYSQKTTGMVLDECVELKKLNSDLVGVNIDLSQKCVEYSVELARMQEIIQDKAAKIKAQTGQLNYFHSDRENISKVRDENKAMSDELVIARKVVASCEHNRKAMNNQHDQIQKLTANVTRLRSLIYKLDFNPNSNLTADSYCLGYEHGKDDGILEGCIDNG